MRSQYHRILLVLLFFITGIFASYPSIYSVTGKVIENDGTPSLYSTIRVYSTTDSIKPVYTGVTDKNGEFKGLLPTSGEYKVNIISTGKLTVNKQVEVTDDKPSANLGTIVLKDDEKTLNEVTVTAFKPLISMEVDRISYDVQADEEAKTAKTDEILKKVPLVSVDPDGNIKVNGGSNYKIYKNGRPNQSFSNNAKDLFKELPASTIEKIEVITEPGAREDAEGSNVILNIVTLKTTVLKGAMGSVSLSYATHMSSPNPSVFLAANYDRFTMSLYGGYNHNNGKRGKRHSTSETLYYDTDNVMSSESTTISPYDAGYFGMEASFEADTLNLFTLDFGGYINSNDSHTWGRQKMTDASGNLLYSYANDTRTLKNDNSSLYGSINYQRNTRRKNESIIISYRIATSKYGGETSTEYSDMVNMPVPYSGIYTDNNERFTENTVQIDWARPISNKSNFDVGGKFINRFNHSKSLRDYYDYNSDESDFRHTTVIGAIYADYRLNIRKFGFVAGLRYEFSRLNAKFLDGTGAGYHANLNDWVPNAGIVFNPNPKNSFRFNFGSRIQRPGISYLNPVVSESPNYTSYGNPDLESVRFNSLAFSYSLMFPKIMLSLNANYTFSNNDIINEQWVEGDHMYSTYGNHGRKRTFYGGLYFNWRIGTKTSIMANAGTNYNYTRNNFLNQKGGGWGYDVFVRLSQQLPWKLFLYVQASSSLSAPGIYTKGKNRSWSSLYYTIQLQRSFLSQNRLTVNVGLTDPFHYKYPGYDDFTYMDNYYRETNHFRYYRTYASLSVSYRFGAMKATVKKLRSVENQDMVGGRSRDD